MLAVAHVRGGSELGADWHIQGKKMNKKNTFHDFLAAARHLVETGYTSKERLALWGRSAGGSRGSTGLDVCGKCKDGE